MTNPTKSGLFPIFDPASVFRAPTIGRYDGVTQSGVAYYVIQAEDGDGKLDDRIGSSVDLQPDVIVKACDSTFTATPLQRELRSMIMVFNIDFPPTFTPTGNGVFPLSFTPRPFNPVSNPTPYPRTLSIQMPALDPDPFVPGLKPSGPGGPSQQSLFRYTVTFKAPRNTADTSVSNGLTWEQNNPVIFAPLSFNQVPNYPTTLTLPDSLGGNFVVVTAELCDCSDCELAPGRGRCVTYKYAIRVQPPPTPPAAAATSSALSPGPGEAVLDSRRRGER
jgi:hypothetical protein